MSIHAHVFGPCNLFTCSATTSGPWRRGKQEPVLIPGPCEKSVPSGERFGPNTCPEARPS